MSNHAFLISDFKKFSTQRNNINIMYIIYSFLFYFATIGFSHWWHGIIEAF